MAMLPPNVREAWDRHEGPSVLTTVSDTGIPNAVYIKSVSLYNDEQMVIADNYFDKTRKNILGGSKGTILFITPEGKSYQIKGSFEYHKTGPLFDHMKKYNPSKHPGHAAAVLNVEEVYSGSERLG